MVARNNLFSSHCGKILFLRSKIKFISMKLTTIVKSFLFIMLASMAFHSFQSVR